MTKALLLLAAATYWLCFAGRLYLWEKEITDREKRLSYLEKGALLIFTAGLVLYIGQLQVSDGRVHSDFYPLPVSLLLFAWSVSAAHLTTEIVYNNRSTAIFANFWTALCLSSTPVLSAFRGLFTDELQWLGFHRLCFLLGYSFLLLALPLALRYLLLRYQSPLPEVRQEEIRQEKIRVLDRMGYRMVLWALPLLSAGIITEALILLEANRLPAPEEILQGRVETLLALAAWFLCGIYLHTRLFLGWKGRRAAGLYLVGSVLLMVGHLTHGWQRM